MFVEHRLRRHHQEERRDSKVEAAGFRLRRALITDNKRSGWSPSIAMWQWEKGMVDEWKYVPLSGALRIQLK